MRFKIVIITLMVWLGLGRLGFAAATSMVYDISVSVTADAIDLVAFMDPIHFGVVGLNETIFSNQPGGNPRCTIQNAGYVDVHFSVAATISGGWELGTTINDVGIDKCVIAGIFTYPITAIEDPYYGRDLIATDFGDNDVLGSVPITASVNNLARDNTALDPDDPEYLKGYSVLAIPGKDYRSMRFMVKTPTEDTFHTEQFFNIRIGAEVY